jgi:hypothetical protein
VYYRQSIKIMCTSRLKDDILRVHRFSVVCLFVTYCIQPRSGHDKLPTPLPSGAKNEPDRKNLVTLKVLLKELKQ